jgi:hypothetical protein
VLCPGFCVRPFWDDMPRYDCWVLQLFPPMVGIRRENPDRTAAEPTRMRPSVSILRRALNECFVARAVGPVAHRAEGIAESPTVNDCNSKHKEGP